MIMGVCNLCKLVLFSVWLEYIVVVVAGCESCSCDAVGSYNRSCDLYSGQCPCKPGVTGMQCDQCMVSVGGQ